LFIFSRFADTIFLRKRLYPVKPPDHMFVADNQVRFSLCFCKRV